LHEAHPPRKAALARVATIQASADAAAFPEVQLFVEATGRRLT
jgi:hypothetical protein